MEVKQQTQTIGMNLDYIKTLLSKTNLLAWVKKFTADNLKTDTQGLAEQLKLETSETSVMLMDSSLVKALITDAKYKGKVHSSYSIAELKEILSLVGKEGTLLISDNPQTPLLIETNKDVVILAPKLVTDEIEAKAEAKKEADKKAKATTKKADDEDEEVQADDEADEVEEGEDEE